MILRKLFSDFDVFDKLQKTHQLVTNKYLPLFVKFDGRFIVEKKNKTDYMYRIWEIHTGWKTNLKKKKQKKNDGFAKWPGNSLNLNPIENLGAVMKECVENVLLDLSKE